MFKLDNNFLTSMGLGSLPVEEKNKLLQAIYERLEMNVGMRLAEKMTDEQLNEFESFIDRSDEAGALHWLESNFPNYKQVVAEELEKLKAEVSGSAPQILAAAASAPAPQMQPGEMPPSQPSVQGAPTESFGQNNNQPGQPLPPSSSHQTAPSPTPTSPWDQPQPGSNNQSFGQPPAMPSSPPVVPAPAAPWDQPPAGPPAQ